MNNDYPFEQMLLSNLYSNINPIYRDVFSRIVDSFDLPEESVSFYLRKRYELISFLKENLSGSTRDPLLPLISWMEQPSKYVSYYGLYITVLLSSLTMSNSISSRYVYTDIRQRRDLKSRLHPDHWKIIKVSQLVSKILPLYGKLSEKGKEKIEERLSDVFSEFASRSIIEGNYDILVTSGQAEQVYANECVKSCMTDNPSNALSFYDKNNIKVVKFLKRGEMIGRAILWDDIRIMYFTYNKSKGKYEINVMDNVCYVDRPYLSDVESMDILMKKLQLKYKNKNLIFYDDKGKSSWDVFSIERQILDLITSNINFEENKIARPLFILNIAPNVEEEDPIPYLDSFVYYIPISNECLSGMMLVSKIRIPSTQIPEENLADEELPDDEKINMDILKYTYSDFCSDQSSLLEDSKTIYNELTSKHLKLWDLLDSSSQNDLSKDRRSDNTSVFYTRSGSIRCASCRTILREDSVLCFINGEYYCEDCAVFSERIGEYLPVSEAVYSQEYEDYIPEDSSIELYSGDYVFVDDAEVIKIYTLGALGYNVRKAWILSDSDDEYIEGHYDLVYSDYLKGYINVRNAVHSEWLDDYFLQNDENIIKVKPPSDAEDLLYDYCPKEYAVEINGEYYYKNDDRVISDQKDKQTTIIIEF